MSDEFDSIEEIEETLYQLIELGLVEACGVDENGEFTYKITDKGKQLISQKEIEDE
tara:strand:- start:428 stop:595 length:168 start_codon:yes stop_codon:yes gene_type:complete